MAGDVAALNKLPGVSATFFDLFDFEHALIANPAAYGLPANLNITTPCQFSRPSTCANSLYFDAIHPTAHVHQAIANAIYAQLRVPKPSPKSP